jgi:HK97 family phage prohead protease
MHPTLESKLSTLIAGLPQERRITDGLVELRAAEGEGKQPKIGGYAAKFDKRSENMGWGDIEYYEVIERGFFDNVLEDDVRCLFNHDANFILGRTRSKTCRIAQDQTGLAYDCDADQEQSYTKDLVRSLQRKDVTQSSFAFRVGREGQRWVEEGNVITRYLKKGGCLRLFDVSPVTYPAYPDATSEARSLHAVIEEARKAGQLGKDAGEALTRAVKLKHAHMLRALDLLALET